jgi:hypothetical protein
LILSFLFQIFVYIVTKFDCQAFLFCFVFQPEVVIEMADEDVAAGSGEKVEAGEPEVKKEDILKEDESEEEEEEDANKVDDDEEDDLVSISKT